MSDVEKTLREALETLEGKAQRYLNDAKAERYHVGYADGILESVEVVERLLPSLPREEEPRTLCPTYICARCYHEKDTCSHCDNRDKVPEAAPGPTPPRDELHHEQCPWRSVDVQRLRSVCGCPPGWPKQAPAEAVTVEQGWALRRKADGLFYCSDGDEHWGASTAAVIYETTEQVQNLRDCLAQDVAFSEVTTPEELEPVYLERRITVREGAGE